MRRQLEIWKREECIQGEEEDHIAEVTSKYVDDSSIRQALAHMSKFLDAWKSCKEPLTLAISFYEKK